MDQQPGFDPNGHGQLYYEVRHPLDAWTANTLADQATAETMKRYPNDPDKFHNDEADAFRHAYWSYLMTKAFGAERAKQFGDGHEISGRDPSGETYMDLYNNQVGRDLAASGGNADAGDVIQNAIRNGRLRLQPY